MLLPGSLNLHILERALEHARDEGDQQYQYKCFRKVILETARRWKAEVVVIDLGPNDGAWNMAMAMSTDYILPPVQEDYFSAASVQGFIGSPTEDSLGRAEPKVFPRWIEWVESHRNLLSNTRKTTLVMIQDMTEKGYYKFEITPKLLPFVVQGYSLAADSSIEEADACFVESIWYMVEEQHEVDRKILDSYVCDCAGKMVIPLLPKLEHQGVSQNIGVSLMNVTKKHIKKYWKDEPKTVETYSRDDHKLWDEQK